MGRWGLAEVAMLVMDERGRVVAEVPEPGRVAPARRRSRAPEGFAVCAPWLYGPAPAPAAGWVAR